MSQFKKKLTAFTAMLAFLSLSSTVAFALPTGHNGTSNTAVNVNGNRMDVDITSGRNGDIGQVDWKTFNVAGNEQVNFGFSGLSQTIINRVLGGQESQILGKLTNSCVGGGSCESFAQTSKVILINPAGIMFGQGSMIDLNSFTASTHDINGIKNIKDVTDLEDYQASTLDKLSPWGSVNGTGKDNNGIIVFDSNYTEAFNKAGVKYTPGATKISMDGATFAHFDSKGNITSHNPNKTLAFVSDNIDYKDSLIRTGTNFNYNNQAYSNVKFITADGATFAYLINGASKNGHAIAEDTKSNVKRTINIDNSGLASNEVAIQSGDVAIENVSNASGSDINISNTVIKGTKLVNGPDGNIRIVGNHDINLDKTRLQTKNTEATYNGNTYNTNSKDGGKIEVGAGKNLNVKDSYMITAVPHGADANATDAGSVRLYGNDNVTIDDTEVLAKGDAYIAAGAKVSIDNSLIHAENTNQMQYTKDVAISAGQEVKVHNSIVNATGDINIKSADANNKTSGNIIISSDLKNGSSQSLILADNTLSIEGANTKIDNVALSYQDIKFYNNNTTGTNNVTIANNATFKPFTVNDGTKTAVSDINLETNGNFTLDNAKVQQAGYSLTFVNDANGNLVDDGGAVDPIDFTLTVKSPTNANNINIKSTQGDVIVKNNSDVTAKNNLTLDAANNASITSSKLTTTNGDITVNAGKNIQSSNGTLKAGKNASLNATQDVNTTNTSITANNNANITAKNGNATLTSTTAKAGNDVNVTAAKDAKLWGDVTLDAGNNVNVIAQNIYNGDTQYHKATTMKAGKDVNVKASNALVNFSNTEAGQDINLEGKTVKSVDDKLTANRNINITSGEDTKIANGKYDAKNNINITAGTDAYVNGDLKATKDVKIKATKNVQIGKSTMPSDVSKTSIAAGNNIDVEATKGKLTISDSSIIADKDVSLKSYETITFGKQGVANINIDNSNTIKAGEDMYITSTNGDINAEKTTMPELQYGDRLTFNAKGNNNFTSEDSLKSVNVDYIAGGSNNFTTKGDIQFVNSSLKAPKNNITTTQEGGDVIMNNLTIKNATTNSKDTVTTINAKGNVTTKDVTGTANADVNATTKKFPQSVDYKGSVTDKNTPDTVLDINKTKLVVNTQVNKTTPTNNDNGSITLTVKNADNVDAGLELTAKNEVWDEQIGKGEGPEVHLNAADDKVAVTKIYTDKLTLSKSDTILAGKDTADGKKPTITVKDQGGFNMDEDVDYDKGNDGFTYDKSKDESSTTNTVRIWDEEKGEYVISQTDNSTVYGKDYVDQTTTTTIKREHEIHFGDNGDQQFNLVYEQIDTEVTEEPGTVTRMESICPELPEIDPEEADSFITQIKLPKEQVEISKTSKVSDNTVDQTSSIMSAAAKVDLSQEANATFSKDKEDEKAE